METDEIYSIIIELASEPNDGERIRTENKYLNTYADLYYIDGLNDPNIKHIVPQGEPNPLNTFVFNVI